MSHGDRRKAGFILGAFIIALVLILLVMLNKTRSNSEQIEDAPWFVETNDPFVTRQLTERDLLPDDTPLVTFLDPQRGAEEPKVTLVEFSDFQCSYCADMQTTIKRIINRFPEVKLVWKDAPSQSLHPLAFKAHLAARCAQDQNAFWEYHDKLFQNQSFFTPDAFEKFADELNLNMRTWRKCFENEAGRVRIERSITEAEVLGIDAIPFLFVNNQRISGTITYEELEQAVLKELQ